MDVGFGGCACMVMLRFAPKAARPAGSYEKVNYEQRIHFTTEQWNSFSDNRPALFGYSIDAFWLSFYCKRVGKDWHEKR